jgi:hypothetical protein
MQRTTKELIKQIVLEEKDHWDALRLSTDDFSEKDRFDSGAYACICILKRIEKLNESETSN